jgi:hypothetical protein
VAQELRAKEAARAGVRAQLDTVGRNLGLAATPAQYQAVAALFEELTGQEKALEAEVLALRRQAGEGRDAEAEAAAALALLGRLSEWAARAEDYAAVGELFRQVNVRLFARFRPVRVKKRLLNKLVGGVVTFGSSAPPVAIYGGPTAREKLTSPAAGGAAGPGDPGSPAVAKPFGPAQGGESLGNVSRGDWIRTSDLLNPIQSSRLAVRTCKSVTVRRLRANPGPYSVLRECSKRLLYPLVSARKGTKGHRPGDTGLLHNSSIRLTAPGTHQHRQ